MEILELNFQFIFLFIWFIPVIFFLLTQQNTLKRIHPDNRSLAPGAVWLQMIPLFGLVWQFVVVSRISDSLSRELNSRELTFSFEQQHTDIPVYKSTSGEKPTYGIGLAYCILMCFFFIPMINIITFIPGIVCWIVYWVKLSDYKNKLYRLSSVSS